MEIVFKECFLIRGFAIIFVIIVVRVVNAGVALLIVGVQIFHEIVLLFAVAAQITRRGRGSFSCLGLDLRSQISKKVDHILRARVASAE